MRCQGTSTLYNKKGHKAGIISIFLQAYQKSVFWERWDISKLSESRNPSQKRCLSTQSEVTCNFNKLWNYKWAFNASSSTISLILNQVLFLMMRALQRIWFDWWLGCCCLMIPQDCWKSWYKETSVGSISQTGLSVISSGKEIGLIGIGADLYPLNEAGNLKIGYKE